MFAVRPADARRTGDRPTLGGVRDKIRDLVTFTRTFRRNFMGGYISFRFIASECTFTTKFLRVLNILFFFCPRKFLSFFFYRKKSIILFGIYRTFPCALNASESTRWSEPIGTWHYRHEFALPLRVAFYARLFRLDLNLQEFVITSDTCFTIFDFAPRGSGRMKAEEIGAPLFFASSFFARADYRRGKQNPSGGVKTSRKFAPVVERASGNKRLRENASNPTVARDREPEIEPRGVERARKNERQNGNARKEESGKEGRRNKKMNIRTIKILGGMKNDGEAARELVRQRIISRRNYYSGTPLCRKLLARVLPFFIREVTQSFSLLIQHMLPLQQILGKTKLQIKILLK
ncbi:hypothetical protein PUN28_017147 [Cardiocondyla obscurior]|uniref:Uncharacterized protein n=1 Tax=Cardiocondyla obscurior TaxID=286306 RepID=A0AAW2EKH2_9HYME